VKQLRISAIVPYFEAHKTIEGALRSLIEGDLPPDEIIVVNDGSSRKSRQQLGDAVLRLRYPSITIVDHQKNLGGGFARNTAVLHSKNDWIFCLDADNLAPKALLMSLASFIEESSGTAEVASPERVIYFDDETATVSHAWTFRNSNHTIADYINHSVLPGSSGNYLFSVDSWYRAGGYPIGARALDAWGFGFRLHLAGCQTHVVPDTFYFHRIGLPSYYVRESRDMKRLSLIATAQVLEDASRLPSKLVRRFLKVRNARSWLGRVKPPRNYNDPRLASEEGFTTPGEAMEPSDLQGMNEMLTKLEHRLESP